MTDFGLSHFFDQLDLPGRFVLIALLSMSLASWTVILLKLAQFRTAAREHDAFFERYRLIASPLSLQAALHHTRHGACARLTLIGLQALKRWTGRSKRPALDAVEGTDFVSTRLALAVARERAQLENGLTTLAAVGSTAPFVGLLGTVWGIYHALVAIGTSGQGTLDKVAGPVGEALLMTAIGLVVAIPAVLAYNAFVRTTQHAAGNLEEFAHELLSFMTTGIHTQSESSPHRDALEAALAGSA